MPTDDDSEEFEINGVVDERPDYSLENVEILIHNYEQLDDSVEKYLEITLGEDNYEIGEDKAAGVSPEKPLLEIKPEGGWMGIPLAGNDTIREKLEENIDLNAEG